MRKPELKPFYALVRHYQWVHRTLGLIGNTSFVIGSIFFFWDFLMFAAIWLFVVGSAGMLVGSLGSAILKLEEEK